MTVYSLSDARNRLPSLLRQVEKGEDVVIARHGLPVARLVPADQAAVRPPSRSLAQLIAAIPQAPGEEEDALLERAKIKLRDIEF